MEPLEGTAVPATRAAMVEPATELGARAAPMEPVMEQGTPAAQAPLTETQMVLPSTSVRMEAPLLALQIQIREAVTEAAMQTRQAVTRSSRMRRSS